jgi:putative spermidine/putrescine transport system ATP-binding protein
VQDDAGAGVKMERVTHRYGHTTAVDAVTLTIEPGELVALLGPSGCGKTTLLRIVAGLLQQSEGSVLLGGSVVDRLPPNERGAGIVFQNYALFPHMTVGANVGYGLRARGMARAEIDATVARMLGLVRMTDFIKRYPRELSGGQQQRVALARTLAVSPKVLLLDEPFGALDKNLRLDMQIEVKRLQRELNITTVMVTHDQEEALSMADRIAVMNHGRVEQFGTPEEIYDRPATQFVAGFVGTTNLLAGTLARDPQGFSIMLAGGRLALSQARPDDRVGEVFLSARPEHLMFVAHEDESVPATIEMALPLGPTVVYEVLLADGTQAKVTLPRTGKGDHHSAGDRVRLALSPDAPVSVFSRTEFTS